ncbi:MAG: DUF2007 domain-containing protein [Candidatus Eisenbacteria bacterium]|nr:DUF2007 domain-containing protein [Candidatus Eisenbacteria bacterium]
MTGTHQEHGEHEVESLSVACTASGEMEAETIKSALEAAGIPTELRIEAAQRLFAVTVDGLGAVRVLVPTDRLQEAKAIIENPASPLEQEFSEDQED